MALVIDEDFLNDWVNNMPSLNSTIAYELNIKSVIHLFYNLLNAQRNLFVDL